MTRSTILVVKFLKMIESTTQEILMFWSNNPAYCICSIVYYIISSLMLGGRLESFFIVLILYVISIMIGFSPFGEKLLRFLNNIRPLETNREIEYLLPLFKETYNKSKAHCNWLQKIEICIIDTMAVNAMALGKRTIAVTKGAMQTFTEDELKAIMAHEIAHIAYLDTLSNLYMVIGNGIFTVIVIIVKFAMFMIENIEKSISQKRSIFSSIIDFIKFGLHISILIFSFGMQIIYTANSRKNEFRADKFAYDLGYDTDMIEALYLLEKISLGDNSTIIQKMIATHPRITLRIKNMEALDENYEPYYP